MIDKLQRAGGASVAWEGIQPYLNEGLALQGNRGLLHTSTLLQVLLQSHGVDRIQRHVGLMAGKMKGARVRSEKNKQKKKKRRDDEILMPSYSGEIT